MYYKCCTASCVGRLDGCIRSRLLNVDPSSLVQLIRAQDSHDDAPIPDKTSNVDSDVDGSKSFAEPHPDER